MIEESHARREVIRPISRFETVRSGDISDQAEREGSYCESESMLHRSWIRNHERPMPQPQGSDCGASSRPRGSHTAGTMLSRSRLCHQ